VESYRISRRPLLGMMIAAGLVRRASAQELREVRVTVSSTSFVLGGLRIGEQAGLFNKNGLQLKVVVMDSGSAAMSALISHSAQFAVAGPGEVLAARARGLDMMVVASLYRGFAGSLVLGKPVATRLHVRADAPRTERLKALDDLTLAVPSATSALLAPMRIAIGEAGAKARFTYMAQPAMVAALETGAIDGMVASFPFAGTPILRGTGVLWIDGPGGDLPEAALPSSSSTLHATGEYVAANDDTVRRFQQTLVDVGSFIHEHPDLARDALAKAYAQLGADEIAIAFSSQKENWTKPFLTVEDMQHELALLRASVDLPGLATLDVTKMLVPQI
jgi:ABC-type nitrate/sulfonate/bicarbonate transport system substrate-binding protein